MCAASNSDAPSSQQRRLTPGDVADMVETMAATLRQDLGRRRIVGVTGAPGAGKSTFCALLTAALGGDAVLVGMDAFHLADEELTRLGRRDRKGAPDTFDVDGYVNLLRRLRSQTTETVYAPRFDRSLEAAIGGAVAVSPSTPLVITEGNYLLLDDLSAGGFRWSDVRPELDEVWYLDVPASARADRLVARHESHGKSHHDAYRWTHDVDLRNAEIITAASPRADLVIEVPDDPRLAAHGDVDTPGHTEQHEELR
ncbi:nucleoside/nucleotide kinase family protein [Rhodococcus sp. MEB064]|uniref:nucleoside/nucleotide kinase family protein n=1 Tax=Rhodococcus sp. MEB064 TaxID=1587522 RepID=UPI0009E5D4F6|nr:nucleoside/nucleotide kinase family protein [Rhodococcus sp. MEB064]